MLRHLNLYGYRSALKRHEIEPMKSIGRLLMPIEDVQIEFARPLDGREMMIRSETSNRFSHVPAYRAVAAELRSLAAEMDAVADAEMQRVAHG